MLCVTDTCATPQSLCSIKYKGLGLYITDTIHGLVSATGCSLPQLLDNCDIAQIDFLVCPVLVLVSYISIIFKTNVTLPIKVKKKLIEFFLYHTNWHWHTICPGFLNFHLTKFQAC